MKMLIPVILCLFSTQAFGAEIWTAGYTYGTTSACESSGLIVSPKRAVSPVAVCIPVARLSAENESLVRLDCKTSFGHYQINASTWHSEDGDVMFFNDGKTETKLHRCAS